MYNIYNDILIIGVNNYISYLKYVFTNIIVCFIPNNPKPCFRYAGLHSLILVSLLESLLPKMSLHLQSYL